MGREPIKKIENHLFTLPNENGENVKCNLSFTIYEPWENKDGTMKEWSRVGNGSLIIANLVKIKLGILKNTLDDRIFFTWPQEKSKGKYWPVVNMDKELKEIISSMLTTLTSNEKQENTAIENDWEMDL